MPEQPTIFIRPTPDSKQHLVAGIEGPAYIQIGAHPGDLDFDDFKPPGGPADWADLPEYPWGPYSLEATLVWDSASTRYRLFRLEAHDSSAFWNVGSLDTGITAVGLRAIRIGRLMYDIARELLAAGIVTLPQDDVDRETRAARATIYARALGANTLDFAADHVGVSRSTVKNLLARARERGLLDG